MAEENKGTQMIDPIAYRSDYDPANIQEDRKNDPNIPGVGPMNANEHFNQYGDDSNPAWQGYKGGLNPKYEGEGVKTSNLEYDPTITTGGLNPNYMFGNKAKTSNNKEAGYLARRNDMIASALYNEGKTSREAVQAYLESQSGWFDSTEADRANTIESVWKRIGQIKPQEEEPQPEKEPADLTHGTAGRIFGKTTADTGEPREGINTLQDDNSVYYEMEKQRSRNLNSLRAMKPVDAATSTYYGTTPYGEQAMRDVQNIDPERYRQYQQELKKLYTQDKVDDISHGAAGSESSNIIKSTEENIVNDQKAWVDKNSTERNVDQVNSEFEKKLKSNQTATSAKQEMLNIKKDLADLNSELEDLPNKANAAFKGDVPEYIYQAYIANNTQRIQKKIQNLESRYNSLSDIYKTEVAQTQWEMEYDLKKQQLEMDETKMNFDMAYKKAQLEQDKIHWSDGKAYTIQDGQVVQLDDGTAYQNYQKNVQSGIDSINEMAENHTAYGQCEQFTDDIAENTAGVRMEGGEGRSYTTSDEKNWYATQFGLFSDYIPEVGDVAVFDYRDATGVTDDSRKYGHTMYVAGYDEATGMIHLVGSNGNGELANRVYSKDMTVDQFYANYGKGFWNPYKYAQWQSMRTKGNKNSMYSPMQDYIDTLMQEYRDSGKTNMFSALGTFQEIYTSLYQSDINGELSAIVNEGLVGTFLENMALSWAQAQGGDYNPQNGSALEQFLGLNIKQVLAEADNYLAQHAGEEKAYAGFQDLMRAVEIKLRDESGAAINQSERATNFLLYLPKGTDTDYNKNRKLQRLEEYIRRLGTEAGIDSKHYIPLNLGEKTRPID